MNLGNSEISGKSQNWVTTFEKEKFDNNAKKIEQNQPLNITLKTYISRFPKLVSKYCVNDCSFSMASIQMGKTTAAFLPLFTSNVLTL